VLEFPVDELGLHPVAKPVGRLECLIETCPRPGEIVLASAMGVGSTGISAVNSERRFIGIEKGTPSSFGSRQKCWALHDGISPNA
jgi:site-specific DNA-methyltransferase (adenine-specific)